MVNVENTSIISFLHRCAKYTFFAMQVGLRLQRIPTKFHTYLPCADVFSFPILFILDLKRICTNFKTLNTRHCMHTKCKITFPQNISNNVFIIPFLYLFLSVFFMQLFLRYYSSLFILPYLSMVDRLVFSI